MARQKFTLAQYKRYKEMPDWRRDDASWKDPMQYYKYWAQTAVSWRRQSKSAFQQKKEIWKKCIELFDKVTKQSSNTDASIAAARIPILANTCYDKIAMLWSNMPIPVFTAIQEQENQLIALANMLKDVELKANSFKTLGFELGIDQFFCDLAVVKAYTVEEEGIFGQDERIVIEQADPFCFWPDPKAKRLKWNKMNFLIYETEMSVGEVHAMYPGSQRFIKRGDTSDGPDGDGTYGEHLKTLIPQKPSDGNTQEAESVRLMEVWFKDFREDFEADWETVNVGTEANPKMEPRIKVDEHGQVVGKWERAYPDGRCIVIANDRYVLSDFGNPYWHKKAPFIMIPARPGSGRSLLRAGEALDILRLDFKINDVEERTHRMAQNEGERPMIAETGTFPTPRSWFKTSKMAEAILIKNPGREFMRMPPTEQPQFIEVYKQGLLNYVDRTSGISAVMRGQLAEGSQISAEGMSSLQGFASSRLKMQAELIAEGVIDLGDILYWLIRETYPSGLKCMVTMGDGTQIPITWNEDDIKTACFTEIDSLSGLPGGQQAGANQSVMFWDKKLVPRSYVLQANKVPGWQQISQQMKQDKLDEIKAAAEGRAIGVGIKAMEKADEKPGRTQAQR